MISVVCAAWNERENIVECCDEIVRVMETLPEYDFELIVCDNDSTDGTLELLRDVAARDKRVKVIANSRNFGAARSAFNGLMATRGDAVIFAISADLQDPPSLIPEFVKKWERRLPGDLRRQGPSRGELLPDRHEEASITGSSSGWPTSTCPSTWAIFSFWTGRSLTP